MIRRGPIASLPLPDIRMEHGTIKWGMVGLMHTMRSDMLIAHKLIPIPIYPVQTRGLWGFMDGSYLPEDVPGWLLQRTM